MTHQLDVPAMRGWSDKQFEDTGFNWQQKHQVQKAFEAGLDDEKVSVLAQLGDGGGPVFDSYQMAQIREIYEKGLA